MNDMTKMNNTSVATKLDDVDDLRSMVNRMAADIYALGRLVEDLQTNEDKIQQEQQELKLAKPAKPSHTMGKRDYARSELILDAWVTINVICALAKIKHHTAENLLWRLRRADEYQVETRPCKGYERMYRVTKVAA